MAASDRDRRSFLGHMMRWAAAGAALLVAPATALAREWEGAVEDDLEMHGPIKEAERWLRLPLERSAVPLLEPYADGQVFLRRWAFGHVVRAPLDPIVLVLVDLDTGGHAELELYARDAALSPVAETGRFGVHVDNGGCGDIPTPLHLRRLAARVARIVSRNEERVRLAWRVPTLREVAERRALAAAPAPAPARL